jgi:hypothetical protein
MAMDLATGFFMFTIEQGLPEALHGCDANPIAALCSITRILVSPRVLPEPRFATASSQHNLPPLLY